MKRDTLIALLVALLLHLGFFAGGQWFKSPASTPTAVPDEPIPVIELVPLPSGEPAAPSIPSAPAGGGESSSVTSPDRKRPLSWFPQLLMPPLCNRSSRSPRGWPHVAR